MRDDVYEVDDNNEVDLIIFQEREQPYRTYETE